MADHDYATLSHPENSAERARAEAYFKCFLEEQTPEEVREDRVRVKVSVVTRRREDPGSVTLSVPTRDVLLRKSLRRLPPGAEKQPEVGLLRLAHVEPMDPAYCTTPSLRSSVLVVDVDPAHTLVVHRLLVMDRFGCPHPEYGAHSDPATPYFPVTLLKETPDQRAAGSFTRHVRLHPHSSQPTEPSPEVVLRDVLEGMLRPDPRPDRSDSDRLMVISRATTFVLGGELFWSAHPNHPLAGFQTLHRSRIFRSNGEVYSVEAGNPSGGQLCWPISHGW